MENCWKRIGVWGQEEPRCPRLKDVIHCRNCEIYTQAGRNLLERELPEDYKEEWTDVLAAKKKEELVGTVSVVIFRIEGEWLALSTQLLEEIIDAEHVNKLVHALPHRDNPVLTGIINVHGEIRLCVSMKELLGLEDEQPKGHEERTIYKRMMVINKEGNQWVFPVDEILGIHRVHPQMFQNVPVTVSKAKSTFTKDLFRWNNNYVAFLDDELLLYKLTKSVS